MRDNRDPATVGQAILQLVDRYKVPVCEAADHYLTQPRPGEALAAPPEPNGDRPSPREDAA